MPFIDLFLKATYVLFIAGSVIFGMSIAVNLLVVITVRKMTKSTNLRFYKTLNEEQIKGCLEVIKDAEQEFANCMLESSEINKVKKTNKIRRFFKLKEKEVSTPTHSVKSVFLNLIKNVSKPVTSGSEKGYMSFSERDLFKIARSVRYRVEEILTSSNLPFIKTLKLSFLLKCLDVYKVYSNFRENALISALFYLINFFMWFSRVFNPVSMSKILIKNASGSTLSSVLAKTTIEIVGKELAVLYFEKTFQEKVES